MSELGPNEVKIFEFDPADPSVSDAEFAAELKRVRAYLPQVDMPSLHFLWNLSKVATRRFETIALLCAEEVRRRGPRPGTSRA